jgi:hypothetical protein
MVALAACAGSCTSTSAPLGVKSGTRRRPQLQHFFGSAPIAKNGLSNVDFDLAESVVFPQLLMQYAVKTNQPLWVVVGFQVGASVVVRSV